MSNNTYPITQSAQLIVSRGNGDTDPNRIYMQSTECDDWIAFPAREAETVVAAIREAAADCADAGPHLTRSQ